MEIVAIGLSLLGIILWTWLSQHNINRKLDKLLTLAKSQEEKEDSKHPNCP